jgi:hypothetical protein
MEEARADRMRSIERFKYIQEMGYRNNSNLVAINMNADNINIVDSMSLQEINELTDILDKYRSENVDVITRELSNDMSDLSKYFMKFNIYEETKKYMYYHYYDSTIII